MREAAIQTVLRENTIDAKQFSSLVLILFYFFILYVFIYLFTPLLPENFIHSFMQKTKLLDLRG